MLCGHFKMRPQPLGSVFCFFPPSVLRVLGFSDSLIPALSAHTDPHIYTDTENPWKGQPVSVTFNTYKFVELMQQHLFCLSTIMALLYKRLIAHSLPNFNFYSLRNIWEFNLKIWCLVLGLIWECLVLKTIMTLAKTKMEKPLPRHWS